MNQTTPSPDTRQTSMSGVTNKDSKTGTGGTDGTGTQWRRRLAAGAVALGALALLIGSGSAGAGPGAGPGDCERGRQHGPPHAAPDQRLRGMVEHVLDDIDADDLQRDQAHAILERTSTELEAIGADRREMHRGLVEALTGESVDRSRIAALRADAVEDFDAVSDVVTRALADLAELLTPEQRDEVARRVARRRG